MKNKYLNNEASELFAKGQFNEALDIYNDLIALNKSDSNAVLGKIICLFELKEYDEALELVEKWLMISPEIFDFWIWKLIILEKLGKKDDIKACLIIAKYYVKVMKKDKVTNDEQIRNLKNKYSKYLSPTINAYLDDFYKGLIIIKEGDSDFIEIPEVLNQGYKTSFGIKFFEGSKEIESENNVEELKKILKRYKNYSFENNCNFNLCLKTLLKLMKLDPNTDNKVIYCIDIAKIYKKQAEVLKKWGLEPGDEGLKELQDAYLNKAKKYYQKILDSGH